MSEPGDDSMFDEYLKRGTDVSRRYRELDADGVPPELDRRVLDQARMAVEKPRRWMRWSAPIALAASAVLVVSIVIETGVDRDAVPDAPQAAAEAPAAQSVPAYPAAPTAAKLSDRADEARGAAVAPPEAVDETRLHRAPVIPGEAHSPVMVVPVEPESPVPESDLALPRVRGNAEPAAPEAASPPAAAGVSAGVSVERAQEEFRRESDKARSRRAASQDAIEETVVTGAKRETENSAESSAVTVSQQPARQLVVPNPEVWLESIRQLRRDGETAMADREWARFREVFPDYPVAEDDTARKPGTR